MEPILFMFYAVLIPSDTASCNTQCMQYSVSTTLTKSMLSHLYQTYNVNDLYYNLWATGQSTYPQSADPNLFAVGCTALHTFLEEKRVIYECINININSHINSQKNIYSTYLLWKNTSWMKNCHLRTWSKDFHCRHFSSTLKQHTIFDKSKSHSVTDFRNK